MQKAKAPVSNCPPVRVGSSIRNDLKFIQRIFHNWKVESSYFAEGSSFIFVYVPCLWVAALLVVVVLCNGASRMSQTPGWLVYYPHLLTRAATNHAILF